MSEERIHRYPGSRPFSDNDLERKLFFGRSQEMESLLHLILAEKLTVVFAKSGMGKTSLLNAGVFQPLRDNDYFPIRIRLNEPDKDTKDSILTSVRSKANEWQVEISEGKFNTLHEYFSTAEFWSPQDVLLKPILVFDQFEEIFSLDYNEADKQQIIAEIRDMVRGTSKLTDLKVVIAIREDFLAQLEEISNEIPEIFQNRFRLTPLTPKQARRAIEIPATLQDLNLASHRFTYQPETLDEIIGFLSQQKRGEEVVTTNEIEPFQLQLICQHVEDQVIHKNKDTGQPIQINSAVVGGQAGMQQILHGFYQKQLNQFNESHRGAVQNLVEKGLISSTGRRLTMEREEIQRIYGVGSGLLETLTKGRLLQAESRLGSTYYELSHDTLVGPILTAYRKRKEIEDKAEQRRNSWRRIRQKVLTLSALAAVVFLGLLIFTLFQSGELENQKDKLEARSKELEARSKELEVQKLKAEGETQIAKRQRFKADSLQGIATGKADEALRERSSAMTNEIRAVQARKEAETEKEKFNLFSASLWLSSQADEWQKRDPKKALQLAWEADQINSNEVSIRILNEIYQNNSIPKVIASHGNVYDLNYAPRHNVFVTAGNGGVAKVWDFEGKELRALKHTSEIVICATFSPSEKYILTSADDTAFLWSYQGEQLQKFAHGNSELIMDVAFSPDEKYIATASNDSTVVIWNVNGDKINRLTRHRGKVWGVDFSPDGDRLATASWDNFVFIWNRQGQLLDTLKGHTAEVYSVSFSSDDKYLLTSSEDGTARLWSKEGIEVAKVSHQSGILKAKFVPEQNLIVTVSYDNTIGVWDYKGIKIKSFQIDANSRSVAITQDLKYLFAAFEKSRYIMRWTLDDDEAFPTFRLLFSDWVRDIQATSDGEYFVTGSYDDTLRIWNSRGNLIRYVDNYTDILSVEVTPDDKSILIGTYEEVKAYDLHTGEEIKYFEHKNNSWVLKIVYSPDGKYFVTGTSTGEVYIWDFDSDTPKIIKAPVNSKIWGIDISPDSERIVAASYDSSKVIVLNRYGEKLDSIKMQQKVVSVKFASNSRDMYLGLSDGKLLKLRGGNFLEMQRFLGHSSNILSIDISANGKEILTCSEDKTAKIWSVDGPLIRSIKHDGELLAGIFQPHTNSIITSTRSPNMVYMWKQKEPLSDQIGSYSNTDLTRHDLRDLAQRISDLTKLTHTKYIWDALDIYVKEIPDLNDDELVKAMDVIDKILLDLGNHKGDSNYVKNLAKTYGNYSWDLLQVGQYEKSLYAAKAGLALDPTQNWINTNSALARLYLNDLPGAISIYKKYLLQPPNFSSGATEYETLRPYFINDWKDLEDNHKKIPYKDELKKIVYGPVASELARDHPELEAKIVNMFKYPERDYYDLIKSIIKKDGNHIRAWKFLEYENNLFKSAGRDTFRINPLKYMQYLSLNEGDLIGGRKYFAEMFKISPHIDYYVGLGTSLVMEEEYFLAIFTLEEVASKIPENSRHHYKDLYNNLAYAYFENEQFEQALKTDLECVRLFPQYLLSYYTLAQSLFLKGDYERAKICLEKLVHLVSDDSVMAMPDNKGTWFWNTNDGTVNLFDQNEKKYYALYLLALAEWMLNHEPESSELIELAQQDYTHSMDDIQHLVKYNINFMIEHTEGFDRRLKGFADRNLTSNGVLSR